MAGVSDVVSTLATPQQGQKEALQLQQSLLDVPSSPSRSSAASADGDTDMTTLIIDIQVRIILSPPPAELRAQFHTRLIHNSLSLYSDFGVS